MLNKILNSHLNISWSESESAKNVRRESWSEPRSTKNVRRVSWSEPESATKVRREDFKPIMIKVRFIYTG